MFKARSFSFAQSARLFFTGLAMGGADLVPGVSGGTIAFIFGIYEELLASINNLSGNTIKLALKGKFVAAFKSVPWSFLIPLGLGLLTALATLASTLSWLLGAYPAFLWSFFFGLVLASVLVVRRKIVTWDMKDVAALVIGTVAAYLVVGAVPVATPENLPAYFLSGAIAICAMILPGISGSFILVILGKYEQVLNTLTRTIHNLVSLLLGRWREIPWAEFQTDIVRMTVFTLGCVVGLALFSRVLTWLFAKHHDIAVAALLGVMIGSLRKIWPWKEVVSTYVDRHGDLVPLVERNIFPALDFSAVVCLFLAVIGIGLILVLDRYAITDEHLEDVNDPTFVAKHRQAMASQEHSWLKRMRRLISRS